MGQLRAAIELPRWSLPEPAPEPVKPPKPERRKRRTDLLILRVLAEEPRTGPELFEVLGIGTWNSLRLQLGKLASRGHIVKVEHGYGERRWSPTDLGLERLEQLRQRR